MKKRIACLLFMCILCLTGCSSNNTTDNGNNGTNSEGNNTTGENTNKEDDLTYTDDTNEEGIMNSEGGNQNNNTQNDNAQNKQEGDYEVDHVKITDPDEALKRLIAGNERFVNDESIMTNITDERREYLEEGQNPYAVIVSCSDSRVTPSIIFNVGLGEIFDVRIAGNIVDSNALGSIEYGVEHLGSPLIVVMGHESCGAVTAAYDSVKNGTKADGNIQSLVDTISPAITDSDDLDEAIHDNIDAVAEKVAEDEIVKHLVDAGKVRIVKAYYSLDGKVTFEDE